METFNPSHFENKRSEHQSLELCCTDKDLSKQISALIGQIKQLQSNLSHHMLNTQAILEHNKLLKKWTKQAEHWLGSYATNELEFQLRVGVTVANIQIQVNENKFELLQRRLLRLQNQKAATQGEDVTTTPKKRRITRARARPVKVAKSGASSITQKAARRNGPKTATASKTTKPSNDDPTKSSGHAQAELDAALALEQANRSYIDGIWKTFLDGERDNY